MKKILLPRLYSATLSGALVCLGSPVLADTFPLSPDSDVVGELRIIIAKHEDTLSDIARRYDLGYNEIVDANPAVDPWLPGAGTPVVVPTQFVLPNAPRQGIVLNVATMRLFYYPPAQPGEQAVVITHPIGIGKEGWSTPLGTTKIIGKQKNPTWFVPASIREEHAKNGDPLPAIVPPGPDNPLGQFAMRLGLPGYLIHGTNKPYGIGMRVSHGCIHLYPEDIAKLFEVIPTGVPVNIINKPYSAGWHNNMLYIEAHTPLEEDAKALDGSLTPAIKEVVRATKAEDRASINWSRLIRVAHRHPGFPVPITMNAPSLNGLFEALPVINEEASAVVADAPAIPLLVTAGQALPGDTPPSPVDGAPAPTATSVSTPPTTTPPGSTATNWYIQAGTFQQENNAQRLTFQLREMEPAITAQYVSGSSGHRVLAGPFSSHEEAQISQGRIRSQLGIQTLIKPVTEKRNHSN